MNLGIEGRTALICASSQGLGLATAEAFATEGCRVATCARNGQTLQAAAKRIKEHHGVEVLAETFDVTDAGVARCDSLQNQVFSVTRRYPHLQIGKTLSMSCRNR